MEKYVNEFLNAMMKNIDAIRLEYFLFDGSYMGNARFICKALCGFAFLWHVYQQGYLDLLKLEVKSFLKLWQPIAVFVGIAMYDVLILFLDFLLSKIDLLFTQTLTQEEAKLGRITFENLAYSKDAKLSIFKLGAIAIKEFFATLLTQFLVFVASLIKFWVLLKRSFFLCILTITGIISLTFSSFPAFKDSFSAWLQKYVGIWMWLPISKVIDLIMLLIHHKVSSAAGAGESMKLIGVQIAFSVLSIVAYSMIPEFANWIVSGASSNVSQFNRISKGLGGKAGNLAMKNPKVRAAAQALKIIKKS